MAWKSFSVYRQPLLIESQPTVLGDFKSSLKPDDEKRIELMEMVKGGNCKIYFQVFCSQLINNFLKKERWNLVMLI